jgi:tRNA(Ile)-lysidine synthase
MPPRRARSPEARPADAPLRAAVHALLGALPPGPIGVACSGGGDSMALADVLLAAARAPGVGGRDVVVVHVDHGLTPGSAAVGQGVRRWARTRGVRAEVVRVDVPGRASLEAAARAARYAALRDVARRRRLVRVLTAHTLDDQAETVLLRIVRGTGPAGLAGIAADDGVIARPLLGVSRAALAAHVRAAGLPTWPDPMNDDVRFTRVRARHAWLPLLAQTNPAVTEALARLATQAGAWREVIEAQARALLGDAPTLAASALAAAPPAVAAHALLARARALGLELGDEHVRAIVALAAGPARGTRAVDVPGGQVVRAYDALELRAGPRRAAAATPAPRVLDADGTPLTVRPRAPGDRMRPARLRGRSRALAALLADAKVPAPLRAAAWVAVSATGEIVWAEHLGPAFGARVGLDDAIAPARKAGRAL